MYPRLLPKIHPFWLTLGYGIFVGYQVRKYDIDKKIMAGLNRKYDAFARRQADIMLDAVEDRKFLSPLTEAPKVAHGTEG